MDELRREVAQLGVRRIEAGRRAVAGATNGGDSARLGSHELEDGDGREGRDGAGRFEVVREVKSGARRRPQSPVWRRGVTVTSTVETLELSLLTRLNDFNSSLTR